MRKKYGLWIILGLFCLMGSVFLFRGNLEKDDFYSYVNRDTLKKDYLGKKSNWSRFTEAQEKVNEKKYQLFSEVISGSKEFDFNFSKNVSIVYQNVKDSPKRNEEGLSLLENYIDDIFSSFSIEELENVIFRIENDLGIDILTHFDVDLDIID